jgi:hypothetical protein
LVISLLAGSLRYRNIRFVYNRKKLKDINVILSQKKVAPKRWKVNVNGRQDAILMLSAISLPGGIQVSFMTYPWPIHILWL